MARRESEALDLPSGATSHWMLLSKIAKSVKQNPTLPVQLQPHLHLACVTNGGRDLTERVVVQIGVRNGEYMAVEHIEHLPSEIQSQIFGEIEALREAYVFVECWKRPHFGVEARHVPERRGLDRECGSIQEQVHRRVELVALNRWTPVVVTCDRGTSGAVEEKAEWVVALQGYREAAQVGLNGTDPPASDNVRGHAAVHPTSPTSPWKFIHCAELHGVGLVELT